VSEMKRVKVSELEGAALDWAVAKAEGRADVKCGRGQCYTLHPCERQGYEECRVYQPSVDWSQAGPLIERYKLTLFQVNGPAAIVNDDTGEVDYDGRSMRSGDGATILIAAIRAIVASVMGDEVEVPACLAGESNG